jgi:hypothetical protein
VHSLAMNEECHSCSCSCSCCINQKRKSCKSALLITHKIDYQIVDKKNHLLLLPFCRDGFLLSVKLNKPIGASHGRHIASRPFSPPPRRS